jgi:hypothetical protein
MGVDIEREASILAHRLAIAKVNAAADAQVRRVEVFFADLRRVSEGVECDGDFDLEQLAPVLDEWHALDRAGCFTGLSPENREALFTRFAPITALDAHPVADDDIIGDLSMN